MSQDAIDPELLKRMMMGEFSSTGTKFTEKPSANDKQHGAKRNLEFDLHFEKLYPAKSKLSSTEKLNLQLMELEHIIRECRGKSASHAYIIVGKGNGVLRQEVLKIFRNKKLRNAEIADPPYFGNAIKVYF